MAFRSLQFTPGLNSQLTPTLNRTGWVGGYSAGVPVSNLVRFPAYNNGQPEVIGGWQPLYSGAVVPGLCRGLHQWSTLAGYPVLGAGSNYGLYVFQAQTLYNITPVEYSYSALSNPFTTTNLSASVLVTDANRNPAVGDYVLIAGASAVHGITLSGIYQIVTVPSGTTYTVTAGNTASGSGAGGGTPTVKYLLPSGPANEAVTSGWGSGSWGSGSWSFSGGSGTAVTYPTIWEIDNWGEDIVAVRRGYTAATGTAVFVASPNGTDGSPAWLSGNVSVGITNAPPVANGVITAMPEQQLIAWGSAVPNPVAMTWGSQDPMLIAWTDYSNYTTWFAATTNAAGSFRLTQGSQIMTIQRSQGQMLVFTDTALASMQFLGGTLIYGFQQLGTNCGLVAPKAAVVVGAAAFWWGENQEFFAYNGTVSTLPCAVRDLVFGNYNASQQLKISASSNTEFSEVQWDYPSASSMEIDSWVSFNYANNTWAYGSYISGGPLVARTSRLDAGVFNNPVGTDASGNVWLHEVGYTAGGASMPWSAQSGYADMAEGEEFVFVDQLIPDAVQTGGDIGITVLAQNHPTDTPVTQGPQNAGSDVGYLSLRLRSRQIAVQFANTNAIPGLFWRLGRVRVRAAADGRQ